MNENASDATIILHIRFGSTRKLRYTRDALAPDAFHLVKIFGNSFGSVENGKRFVGSSHWKIPGKSGKSKKVGPFSRLELSERNFVFHYTFLRYQLGSHLGVPSGNGLDAVPGFTIKWNNFLPIAKSIFVPTEISEFFA